MFKMKRWKATMAAVSMAAMMACGSATPVFAQSNENAGSDTAVVVEESTQDSTQTLTTDKDKENDRDVSGALTPDGNLTLVDDLDEEASEELQFMTVTTRDGSYYYIIIDRSGSSENVYFLNSVDTVDLMNLMSDEEKEQFTGTEEPEKETVVDPIVIDDKSETTVDEKEPEAVQENNTASTLPILAVFGVIGALIVGGYYMLKIKPKKGQGSIDEDREFYDDDEYENEDDMFLIDEAHLDDEDFDFGDEETGEED